MARTSLAATTWSSSDSTQMAQAGVNVTGPRLATAAADAVIRRNPQRHQEGVDAYVRHSDADLSGIGR